MDTLERMYEKRQINEYLVIREKSGKCIVGVTWGTDWSGHGEGPTMEEAVKLALRNHPVSLGERKAA